MTLTLSPNLSFSVERSGLTVVLGNHAYVLAWGRL
jgi:hypothetical protein